MLKTIEIIIINFNRTFHNVLAGGNVAMHVLLLELEARLALDGFLPEILFIQADGRCEHANKTMIGKFVLTALY